MPYFWAPNNLRTSDEKAIGFSYAFRRSSEIRQCHKHPFDQWTQQVDQFKALFSA